MQDRVTVPAWAGRIKVKPLPGKIVVIGERRVQDAAIFSRDLPSQSRDLLSRHVPILTIGQKQGATPPHLEFALAKGWADQLKFVRKYGPVWGEVVEPLGRVVVEQPISVLRREQKIFGAVTEMVAEVSRAQDGDLKRLESLCLKLLAMGGFAPGDTHEAILDSIGHKQNLPRNIAPGSRWERQMITDFYTYHVHWMIGIALDRFPPSLTYFAGRPAELPPHSLKGVLPTLYFMLRKDYLASQPRIASCANVNCRKLFAIERAGQRFCSAHCSALQRGRDYWRRAGRKRRRDRQK